MLRRTSLWLLATAGVVVGHVVGYAVAHPTGSDRAAALAGHEYLGELGTLLLPLGLVAVMALAIQTVRRLGDAPTLAQLASLQVALFGAQEVLERALGPGAPVDVLAERGVWFGVVAQVVVAWVALRLVRHTATALRRIVAGGRRRASASTWLPSVPERALALGSSTVSRLPCRRGPPSGLVPAR